MSADLLEDFFHRDHPQAEPFSTWTLCVENLGKLKQAELRIRPLMLLVGENNTGKTYLATILYAIVRELRRLLPEQPRMTPAYERCAAWVRGFIAKRGRPQTMAATECALFIPWLNEVIADHTADLLALAFNHEASQPTRVELCDLELFKEPSIRVGYSGTSEEDSVCFVDMEGSIEQLHELDESETYSLVKFIALRIVHIGQSSTVYLPASRTGIVQLYQEVQIRSNDRRRLRPRQTESAARLTPPVLDLIDDLTRSDPEDESRFSDEARELETHCLHGTLERPALPAGGGYQYRPSTAVALPMALSSAVVTELVPIILTLRHKLGLGLLILDEPEAHLHPRLQRALALVIVHLVRKGLRVCLTTHSENFCQQINNFIKIGALPDPSATAERLGYDSNAYLRSEEVAGYEFKNMGAEAEMHRLPQSPTGLAMPMFNDELLKLSDETLRLQEMLAHEADAP